jgi:hypothetical protein
VIGFGRNRDLADRVVADNPLQLDGLGSDFPAYDSALSEAV